jgi:3-hydroxyisobutyrate dehydrogenase
VRIGMLGLGNMGGRIARRIHAGGAEVLGFDLSRSQMDSSGVPCATSTAEVIEGADIIFFSLPDSRAVESVVYGEGGVLERVRNGQTVVDLSTSTPASSVKIHDALSEVGVEFLDAGISGGPRAAEDGALTIMVGGSRAAVDAVTPILDVFSSRIYYMGRSGTGHVTKLLNNFLNGVSLASTAEAMIAAKKAGLNLGQVLDVFNHSTGVSYATLHRFPRIIDGDYVEGGLTSELMAKDLRLYLELLQSLGVTSFTGTACLGSFNLAIALGYGQQVSNRLVDALGDIAGGVRIHETTGAEDT